MTRFALATEDALSEAVAEKVLLQTRRDLVIAQRLRKNGFGYLKGNIGKFNQIADRVMPLLVLTDLDRKCCPPAMIDAWLPQAPSRNLMFRIAVRETESWLLADRGAFAHFVGVSVDTVPAVPDELADPKATLLKLVRRSKNRDLKRDVLPLSGVSYPIGLGYNDRLCGFVRDHWDSARAAKYSPSLARAMRRIAQFQISAR